ncbi:MAG: hypothetical protein WDO24_10290 [Pseudomonadota bacterium]
MSDLKDIEDRIQAAYPALGPQLRRAARFLLSNPSDVALYPLRQVAEKAEVAPTTFVRLAEQIGFAGYKSLRDALRAVMRSGSGRYAADVGELLANDAGFNRLHHETADTLIRNIGTRVRGNPGEAYRGGCRPARRCAADLRDGPTRKLLGGFLFPLCRSNFYRQSVFAR